jgi:receptor protein-tyrosine kinase
MSSPPKSSLVERLVQDRLRSGDLEASAAQLLQLGDGAPGGTAPDRTVHGDAGPQPNRQHPDPIDGLSVKPTSFDLQGPDNGAINSGGIQASPIRASMTQSLLTTQALVTEPPLDQFTGDAFRDNPYGDPAAPMALELRPIVAPAPPPAPATSFPLSGLAPSALVPPPATALPVSGQPTIAAPHPEPSLTSAQRPAQGAAQTPARMAAPPIVSQTGTAPENERPDLVQGPPTIDAVALERGGMVDWSRTRSRISEEFRLVQRQILRAAFGPGAEPGFSNLLMVTSARPGEGKSFTSVNLAGSIARQGDHHVLLVDADSKRDSFCYALGLAEMRGLLDLVANPKLDPSPLIVKTPIDRLSILPVGRERERSAELFSTKEMTRLIQSLGRRYADRLLVLDAPPCLSTSDPAVLAPVVGQILFVVEADRTQRDEVEASLDLIQACPNITLVLNKQQISSRYTFGAYSSYYSS